MRRFSLSQRLTLLFILLMMLCATVACAVQLYTSTQYGNAMVQRLSGGLAQQIVQREPILDAQGRVDRSSLKPLFDRLMTFNPSVERLRRQLSKSLGAVEMGWIQTGLEYQAFHTLAIFGLAVAMQRRISIWFYWSSVFLALGTVLFSGSLYCLALSHLRLWAFVTPVGGVSFLVGWVLMFIGAIRLKRKGVVHE